MNDIIKRPTSALSADLAQQLLAGIEASESTTMVAGGGADLLKLGKNDGVWVIGQGDEPMEVGSQWWIDILSLCHGWVCWSNHDPKSGRKNERLGEIMAPMSAPKPKQPDPIDGFAFKEQRSFEAVCLDGVDTGREVQFKNGSTGTLKAFKKLQDSIKAQLRSDRAHPCPVITLTSEKYKHPQYSWIQNPIFTVVGWADLNGNLKSAEVAAPAGEAEVNTPPPASTRVRPPLGPTPGPLGEAPEPPPRTAQRRRPQAA